MKNFIYCTIIGLFISTTINGQVLIKTEHIGSSSYKNEEGEKTGGKGGLTATHANFNIPISVKVKDQKVKAWSIALGGTYASFNNKHLAKDESLSEILNAQLGLVHLRPIGKRWSIMANAGVAWLTADLKRVSGKSILGQGGVLFIRHEKHNINWGFGVSLNNMLGYPMIFPSLYFDWKLEGRYSVNASLHNSVELAASVKLLKFMKLGITSQLSGLGAAVKHNGKDMIFTNQYAYAGLQPELVFGKVSIPIIIGVTFAREAFFQDRTIKAMFENRDDNPRFGVAPYYSIGFKYGF